MIKLNMSMNDFLKKNLWQIIVAAAVFVWGYSMLNSRVETNAQDIIIIQAKLAQYPSADYFNLKFQNLTDKINTLQTQVDKIAK